MPKRNPLKRAERAAARALIRTAIATHGTKAAAALALGISRQGLDKKLAAK